MRLTVGPLPAAVYWRRRAAVVGALVFAVVLFLAVCSGPNTKSPRTGPGEASRSQSAGNVSTSTRPGTGPVGSGNGPTTSATAGPGATASAEYPKGGDDAVSGGLPIDAPDCTDDEMLLTATAYPNPGAYAGVLTLTLIVRNTSTHTCLRDVGSAVQELRVVSGSVTIWSSDGCPRPETSDVRAFGANIESQFPWKWDTHRLAPHECNQATTPAARGTYQLIARLGNKWSTPVTFQIT